MKSLKKRQLTVLIAFALAFVLLAACSKGNGYDGGCLFGYGYSDFNDEHYRYDDVYENAFISTREQTSSNFSLDRNTASYGYARREINAGLKPSPTSVRIEEYVNYFSYNYKKPEGDNPLAVSGALFDCPWREDHKLFTVGVAAKDIDFGNKKSNNLVFLIDVSGSMFGEDRLGLIQQAFTMLAENLTSDDRVSIVTYASGTKVVADGIPGGEKTKIANILQNLKAGGSTAGAKGIQTAYDVARRNYIEGGNNRVLLATDGDFNVGISSKSKLKEFIASKRDGGVYLSVLGVGTINTRDDLMETLARSGNGNYGYLDNLNEARKMLVGELGGTLETVAKDAKIRVEFNAETVRKFRLIGYENKMLTDDEFNDEKTDAGEIGAGHTVTAVYELELRGTPEGKFADVILRCKTPDGTDEPIEITESFDCSIYDEDPSEDEIFISCVVEYGLLLRNSDYMGTANFKDLSARLEALECVTGEKADGFKREFFEIVQKASKLYKEYSGDSAGGGLEE